MLKFYCFFGIMKNTLIAMLCSLFLLQACAQGAKHISAQLYPSQKITAAADRTAEYLPYLKGKRVALYANQTSMVGTKHLVDTLLASGVKVVVIFGPEHGFRGTADAGEKVNNAVDEKTGIPIVSLYGKQHMPTAENLANVDVMVFDIQDVGTRFYTYINSLQHYLEAAILNNKPMLLLDRPNPNGFYVDGPVLQPAQKSGIGLQPIPIVYGMTMAEYAKMLIGERWLSEACNKKLDELKTALCAPGKCFELRIVNNENYTHKSLYQLPVPPSPNLREMQSVYLYPSTCFFEGTVFSEGRGTDKPFQIFGHPDMPKNLYAFTPKPNEGAKSSKNFYKQCYGWNLHTTIPKTLEMVDEKIQLKWFMDAYKLFPNKDSFFLKNNFIAKLAGYNEFSSQIKKGLSESDIRKSWEPALSQFKAIRKKYLLYADFE